MESVKVLRMMSLTCQRKMRRIMEHLFTKVDASQNRCYVLCFFWLGFSKLPQKHSFCEILLESSSFFSSILKVSNGIILLCYKMCSGFKSIVRVVTEFSWLVSAIPFLMTHHTERVQCLLYSYDHILSIHNNRLNYDIFINIYNVFL